MKRIIITIICTLLIVDSHAQIQQQLIDFEFEGIKLSGVLDLPQDTEPKGIVLIIHGDGKTNAVADNWWFDVRTAISKAGYATYMWDKMGCGNSEGTYKSGRLIENEALEVMAAIENLKKNHIKGSDRIGLWGISRAGWIIPVVIYNNGNIDFWISVSGVDDDETFKYLLEQNLRINGYSKDIVELIVDEWHDGILISRGGGSYEYYLSATQNLQNNKFWNKINNGEISEKKYYAFQKQLQQSTLDKKTDLPLYVTNFSEILSDIKIPVLALFGETDMTVNWKKTKALYQKSMGNNADLTIKTFSNCNHNMWQAKTGGLYESENENWNYIRCEGFLDSITDWLSALK
ncbi:MAG: CocE/NonD family hydrolase [Nonlabens sp.]